MLQVNPRDPNGSGVQWIKSSQTHLELRHRQQLKVAGVATVKSRECDTTSGGGLLHKHCNYTELYLFLINDTTGESPQACNFDF